MKKNALSAIFLLALMLSGCVDPDTTSLDIMGMFNGSSPRVDQRFADSQAYNAVAGFPIVKALSDNYRIFVHTDTHVDTSRHNLEFFIHQYRNALDCPLAIHLGDLIDAQNHWELMQTAYTDIPQNPDKVGGDTLFVMAGNHDIYFKQWEQYKQYCKTSTYYFIVETPSGKRDLFLILDSAEGTLGIDQLAWFKETLNWADTQNFRHKVVCTHTHLFKSDASQGHTSNYELEETYELLSLMKRHGVEMFWCGHDHSREISTIGGVTCIVVDALLDKAHPAGYMIASMGDVIDYQFVEIP